MLPQCLFKQKRRLIFRFNTLWKILIDNKHFLDKSRRNYIFFGNFNNFRLCYAFRGGRATDYFVRMKILYDFIGFYGVVLVALVHNNHKADTIIESVLNMLQKVGAFTVFKGVIAFLRQLFPVYKTTVVFLETCRHNIGE